MSCLSSPTIRTVKPKRNASVDQTHFIVLVFFWPQTDDRSSVHHLGNSGHADVLVKLYDLLHPLDLCHSMVWKQHNVELVFHLHFLKFNNNNNIKHRWIINDKGSGIVTLQRRDIYWLWLSDGAPASQGLIAARLFWPDVSLDQSDVLPRQSFHSRLLPCWLDGTYTQTHTHRDTPLRRVLRSQLIVLPYWTLLSSLLKSFRRDNQPFTPRWGAGWATLAWLLFFLLFSKQSSWKVL